MNQILYFLFTILFAASFNKKAFCQIITGSIEGKITDQNNEPVPFASIRVLQSGNIKGMTKSTFNGMFKIKPIKAGIYSLEIYSIGYNKKVIKLVEVKENKISINNISLKRSKGIRGHGFIFCNECGTKSKARFYNRNDTMRVSSYAIHNCRTKEPNVITGRLINQNGNGVSARIDFYKRKELKGTVRSNNQGFFHFERKKYKRYSIKTSSLKYKSTEKTIRYKKGEVAVIKIGDIITPK
jgi:hypothetical protein